MIFISNESQLVCYFTSETIKLNVKSTVKVGYNELHVVDITIRYNL